MIAAHVHNSQEPSKGLKALAKKYLNRENKEEQRLLEWFANNGMRAAEKREYIKVPEEIIVPYAKADVEMTLGLFEFYRDLGVIDDPTYKLEMQLVPIVMNIVRRGMKIDKEFAQAEALRSTARVIDLLFQAKEKYNIDNLGSAAQVSKVLVDAGVKVTETEKGNPALDEISLATYDHPIVSIVQEYRELIKLNGTYLQPMLFAVDAEGVLHASLNQVGTRTGRFSSSNPNIQNIPRSDSAVDVRKGFVTRGPDFSLLLVDLSQIELRILAHYCQEPIMLDALRTRKGDLHAATAELLFGSSEKRYRTVAKTLNFATIYGAGATQLAESLNKAIPGTGFTLDQAKEFKARYFAGYPKLREFIWAVENKIRRAGEVFDVYGRRYKCEPDVAYRAVNYLIQGCAAGVCKKSMVVLDTLLRGKKSGLINIIHDEFIFDLHADDTELIPEIIKIIEGHDNFRVPIFANASISETNWADKHDLV
jgi:DNA polymerase-1